MAKKDITNMRGTIDFLKEQGEILSVGGEVDPIYENAAIQKSFEGSFALLFEKIRGYPGTRHVANVFSREERVAKIFDVADSKELTLKCVEAMRHPVPPKIVEEAPCQEVVIMDNIDVLATIPILKQTEKDAARISGGGIILLSGKYFRNGSHVSFNRMHFRGKDWSSMAVSYNTHLGIGCFVDHKGERVPVTINICPSPAVMMVAGTWFLRPIVPPGADELGFAGGLQGSPVRIVRAKTVDAYAIADSEWVIEGYIEPEWVWETVEAEKSGKVREAPLFPEWAGYLGRAMRVSKFQATAITHRQDRPIYFQELTSYISTEIMSKAFREACFYELAERLFPGLVVDVNILKGG